VHQIAAPVSGAATFCSIGLAFDGVFSYYDRCGDPNVYKINPVTGALVSTFNTGITERPNALTFDRTRNGIWIGTQTCNITGMPIYFWDFDDNSVTQMFTVPFGLINPATGGSFVPSCFVDGLAFNANNPTDSSDDELWFSDDVNRNVGVFRPDGTFVKGFDATTVHPSLSSTSGLAIGGPNLYLANNGGGDVFRANKSTDPLTLVDQFTSGDTRQEDMECDPITFAPKEVMWVRTTPQGGAFPDVMTAFEIEPTTCSLAQITPPAVQKSKTRRLEELFGEELAQQILLAIAEGICVGVTSGACVWAIPFLHGLAAVDGAGDILQLALIIRDPPSSQFDTIFVPRDYQPPVMQRQPGVPQTLVEGANDALASLTDLYELVEAWRITLERYQGAIATGDEVAAQAQLGALEAYILATSPRAFNAAAALQNARVGLESFVGPLAFTGSDIEAGRAALAVNGLPQVARDALANLGLSEDAMAELLTQLLALEIDDASQNVSALLEQQARRLAELSVVLFCVQDSTCDPIASAFIQLRADTLSADIPRHQHTTFFLRKLADALEKLQDGRAAFDIGDTKTAKVDFETAANHIQTYTNVLKGHEKAGQIPSSVAAPLIQSAAGITNQLNALLSGF
jgi:hypothetical protein